jgi:hypothetical protein
VFSGRSNFNGSTLTDWLILMWIEIPIVGIASAAIFSGSLQQTMVVRLTP